MSGKMSLNSYSRLRGLPRVWQRNNVQLFVVFLLLFNTSLYIGWFWFTNNPESITTSTELLKDSRNLLDEQYTFDSQIHQYDLSKLEESDLETRVHELIHIRVSVLKELQQFEQNRTRILRQISQMNTELETMKNQITKKNQELEQLQLYMRQAIVSKQEINDRAELFAQAPMEILPREAQPSRRSLSNVSSDDLDCQMFNCFDHSRCSMFSSFHVYFYPTEEDTFLSEDGQVSMFNSVLSRHIQGNIHITKNANIACLYVAFIPRNFKLLNNLQEFQDYLHSLPHWGGDGRNNLLLNSDSRDLKSLGIEFGRAMIAQTHFSYRTFSPAFDLILPSSFLAYNSSVTLEQNAEIYFPKILPARRKYFLTYLGRVPGVNGTFATRIKNSLNELVVKHSIVGHNEFVFDFACDEKTHRICDNQSIILVDSTFSVVFDDQLNSMDNFSPSTSVYNEQINAKLMATLHSGAIPVIVGGDYLRLPFEETLDWNRAAVLIPISRISEIYVILKTLTDSDIVALRTHGAQIYRNYFLNPEQIVRSLFALVRTRLNIPAPTIVEESAEIYYDTGRYSALQSNTSAVYVRNKIYADDEEMFGPLEAPFDSPQYSRNYSVAFTDHYRLWNDPQSSPFFSFPSLVNDPVLPTDAKFMGSSFGFRPIANGAGGTGKEFSQALGGNHVKEQFTIVILTYEREKILLSWLPKLKDLPYLNKVVIVWNSPHPPSSDIVWPDIGVDIVVVKASKNSLNNRFLPYDEIKTDAILSLDDDSNFRHDEIVFAFRVWREARDRIVGFPARGHVWNGHEWRYQSEHTCQFSMVLTGAAFYHKYYTYLYSHLMPREIRDKIDEVMNCEDIAMNFLVAHVTRQPPLKVTGRWNFNCPTCPNNLSGVGSHYVKRHKCINYFARVYGYMPLLYTQFRADSVLYRTRIPQKFQKCYKYI